VIKDFKHYQIALVQESGNIQTTSAKQLTANSQQPTANSQQPTAIAFPD